MHEWFNAEGYRADVPALRARYPFLATLDDWVTAHGTPPWADLDRSP